MEERINAAVEDVKQILARAGGSIELVEVTEDNIAKVRLMGHCAGCPGARMTLKGIVEQILGQAVPEIKGVEAVD